MADSIMQEDNTHCFLCGMNSNLEPLDLHHIYNKADKKKSEKYGLMVYLHHSKCHIFGKNSVHQNAEVNNALKAKAQQTAMKHYGWSVEDWLKIFGRNYL